MEDELPGTTRVRRFWMGLWALAAGLLLAMLFATLRDRSFDPLALQHFSTDVLDRGRQFSREARTAATVQSLLTLAAMLALCFHPIGARLLRWLEGLGRGKTWRSLIAVSAGITLLTALLELPLSLYLGYSHEKAYGLSKESLSAWLGDHLTGLAVGLGLALLFWLPIYWMIRRWPRGWWVPAALANVLISGLLAMLWPVLLLPLEGRVVEVTDPQLLAMVERVAARAGVEVEAVKELQVSHRTSRINAMVTGIGATKQVVVYDTLLQQFRPDEIEVVMAHELSHAIHRDVVTGWLLTGAGEMLILFAAAWMLRAMAGVGPLHLPAPHAARGLALLLLLMSLTDQVTAPIHNAVSRRAEVRADQFALTITGNPRAFVGAFKKLAAGNPGDVDPPALVEFLSHSHPSIMNRIRMAVPQR